MSDIVQKLWGFCHTLRHDGIDYGDYIEQITYLLFIKMADEREIELPEGCDWRTTDEHPRSGDGGSRGVSGAPRAGIGRDPPAPGDDTVAVHRGPR